MLPAEEALRVLCPVSLWMQEELQTDEVERDKLHSEVQPKINTMDDTLSAEDFCRNLRDRAGLIADYGDSAYIFRHKSFREWFEAQAYCFWLSALEATSWASTSGGWRLYRLPTEFEWEWAAGGGKCKYPWASEKGSPSDKLANYEHNVGVTTPVGRYPDGATPEGLMDMAGNVWEWMENWLDEDENEGIRPLRGGSWAYSEHLLKCTADNGFDPDYHSLNAGFRVVRSQSYHKVCYSDVLSI